MPSQRKQSEMYHRVSVLFGSETGEALDLSLLSAHFHDGSRNKLARRVLREYLRANRELIDRLRSVETL